MERLGRGVVVLHSATSQAYIGWRLLATDSTEVGFNLYRSANGAAAVKLNSSVITNTTDFLDTTANFTISNSWYVVPVTNGVEAAPSAAFGLAANSPVRQYLSWPLHAVTGGANAPYDVKFCWVGDLDGDGEYDYVVDRQSTTGGANQYLQAYKRDGTFLWQLDCGYNSTNQYNIEPGASAISVGHGDCVTVYDLDGDGKAEVCIRTARGVVLPDGTTITGPDDTTQYLSILDGVTGHELARTTITNMWPADGPMNAHFGIMYCDGVHPSLLIHCENRNAAQAFQRETMTYDYRNGQLTRRWFHTPAAGANESWGHQIRIMDVNHDGIDDLINVGSVLNGADGSVTQLTGDEAVSMNFWGFTPALFPQLNVAFENFMKKSGGEQKSECLIPATVGDLVTSGKAKCKVLRSADSWFGVTYREDRPVVVENIRKLIAKGDYPEKLWA